MSVVKAVSYVYICTAPLGCYSHNTLSCYSLRHGMTDVVHLKLTYSLTENLVCISGVFLALQWLMNEQLVDSHNKA